MVLRTNWTNDNYNNFSVKHWCSLVPLDEHLYHEGEKAPRAADRSDRRKTLLRTLRSVITREEMRKKKKFVNSRRKNNAKKCSREGRTSEWANPNNHAVGLYPQTPVEHRTRKAEIGPDLDEAAASQHGEVFDSKKYSGYSSRHAGLKYG